MPKKVVIEIEDRAILVLVQQYDAAGNVIGTNIANCLTRDAEHRDEAGRGIDPIHPHRCQNCGTERKIIGLKIEECPKCGDMSRDVSLK